MRTLQLLKYLKERHDLNITVYLTSGEQGILDSEYKKYASIIYRDKNTNLIKDYFNVVSDVKPSVIHINANLASGIYCFIGKILSVPIRISHIRTAADYGSGVKYRIKKFIFNILTNTFSTKIVGVCDGARKLTRTPKRKWITIYNGISRPENVIEDSRSINSGLKIIMLGRLDPVKNHAFVVELMSLISSAEDISVDIYGSGDVGYTSEISTLIAKKGLQNIIRLRGEADNPMEIIPKYDLMVLPSLREGLPGVALESLCCGIPVIASDLPGCKEIGMFSNYIWTIPVDPSSLNKWVDIISSFDKSYSKEAVRIEMERSPFNYSEHCKKIINLWGGA